MIVRCYDTFPQSLIIAEFQQASRYFALMTDESIDIAILKQLVLIVRYITSSGIKGPLIKILDI